MRVPLNGPEFEQIGDGEEEAKPWHAGAWGHRAGRDLAAEQQHN